MTKPLFFLHIRKTAGSSVRNLLMHQFSVSEMLLDWHHRQNAKQDPSTFSFVTGHCSVEDVRRFSVAPFILLFLRQPVDRALSAYFYYRGHSHAEMEYFRKTMPHSHFAQRDRFRRRSNELTLIDFLRQEEELARLWLSNVQTRVLAGATDGEPQTLPDLDLLAMAMKNITVCDVIGLTERFQESMQLLYRNLGMNFQVSSRHDNGTPKRLSQSETPRQVLELLAEWNQLDLALYREAYQRFERKISSRDAIAVAPNTQSLPSAAHFSFDQPILGGGWHPREYYQDRWICWTNEDREATLELQLQTSGPHRLVCRLEHSLTQRSLESLNIYLDTHGLSWQLITRDQERWLCASVPAGLIPAHTQQVRLRFQVREPVRPCDLDPTICDHRVLGIALSQVRLIPQNGCPDASSLRRKLFSRIMPW